MIYESLFRMLSSTSFSVNRKRLFHPFSNHDDQPYREMLARKAIHVFNDDRELCFAALVLCRGRSARADQLVCAGPGLVECVITRNSLLIILFDFSVE
jgi:hypothetical protein